MEWLKLAKLKRNRKICGARVRGGKGTSLETREPYLEVIEFSRIFNKVLL